MYALALEDLAEAAALFHPEWERTAGVDGYVSLEVPQMSPSTTRQRWRWPACCMSRPTFPTCW